MKKLREGLIVFMRHVELPALAKYLILLIGFLFGTRSLNAQISEQIENISGQDFQIIVTFFDPYENLIVNSPDFNKVDSLKQQNIWNSYLKNNVIYDFKLLKNGEVLKHYILRGDPSAEVDAKNLVRNKIYLLDITKHEIGIDYYNQSAYSKHVEKTINKIDFYGTLFENMDLLYPEKIGKNLFGNFRLKIPYNAIRDNVLALIRLDLYEEFPAEWIVPKNTEYLNEFFSYQSCIQQYYRVERIMKTFVRTYNDDGSVQSEYPRLETDEDVKSFVGKMNRIGDVVTLPFFNSTDKSMLVTKHESSSVYKIIIGKNEPIEKYLENIQIIKNSENEIDKITATLLIHGSSLAKGEYIIKESYVAYFKDFDKCRLPYKILFSPEEDIDYTEPRIEIQLDYLFHRK